MTNNYSWKNYNDNLSRLIKKNVIYNSNNQFNACENSYYSQTRDIFALAASTVNTKKILDFGSNLSLISNLINKINIKNKKFYIYDPFFQKKNYIKIENIDYVIFSDFKEIIKIKFDLIHFGSCVQYIENFYSYLDLLNFNKKSKILFTATPFNLFNIYSTKQINHKNLFQTVHSYKKLIKFLKLKKFDIVFKSSMNIKFAALHTIKPNTFFLNLLFQKK